jgi:hypothetical protein
LNGAVSKTVGGGNVARGFESLPLRFPGLVEPNSPQTGAFDGEAGTSPDRGSGVNERQRTSTTASVAGISFPPLPLSPARARHRWSRCCAASSSPVLRSPPVVTSASTAQCGTQSSECCVPTKAALTPAMAAVPDLVRSGSELGVRDTALVPRQRPSTGRPDRRRRECRSRTQASVSTSRTPRPPDRPTREVAAAPWRWCLGRAS